jgi:hypothetical protein
VGSDFQGHFWVLKRAHQKNFPEMLATQGVGEEFSVFSPHTIPKLHFLTKFFFKTLKFPNEKGTFDVNLVIYSDISLYKKGTFHPKKGTFGPSKKWGGGHVPPVPPVPTPLLTPVLETNLPLSAHNRHN